MLNKATFDKERNAWIAEITYDVTDEGIVFANRRNYDHRFIKKLIEGRGTQEAIEQGYCLVMYGHEARDEKYLMNATEYNPITGKEHFPLGSVMGASMNGKMLTLNLLLPIIKGTHTETVVELMKHGIGGFSTFFSQKQKRLLGVDYTYTRNFARNKIDEFLADSMLNPSMLCGDDGVCRLDATVKEQAHDIAKSLKHSTIPIEQLERGIEALIFEDSEVKRIQSIKPIVSDCQSQLKIFQDKLSKSLEMQKHLEEENLRMQRELETPKVVTQEVVVEKIVKDKEQKKINKLLKKALKERGLEVEFKKTDKLVLVEPTVDFLKDSFVSLNDVDTVEIDTEALTKALQRVTKKNVKAVRI